MKTSVHHIAYGQIEYEENFWTGQRALTINGTKLTKQKKNVFAFNNENETLICQIKGNLLSGVKLNIDQDVIELTPTTKWYEYACSISIFMLILVWGNVPALCKIIPVVGGAIGGAISGLAAFVNVLLMKKAKNAWSKLLVWLGMLAATFFICFLVALFVLTIFY